MKRKLQIPKWSKSYPWPLIKETASLFGVDPGLIAALIRQESNGNPWVCRYEPRWIYTLRVSEFASQTGQSYETERVQQSTSWGYMQIMGAVSRELGFKEPLAKLIDPDQNIYYGTKKLKECLKRYPSFPSAVSAYNAGTVLQDLSGRYSNQPYVDNVMRYYSDTVSEEAEELDL